MQGFSPFSLERKYKSPPSHHFTIFRLLIGSRFLVAQLHDFIQSSEWVEKGSLTPPPSLQPRQLEFPHARSYADKLPIKLLKLD